MTNKFQIFGSASSLDYDVMVFVDKLESIESNHQRIKILNVELENLFALKHYDKKKINANLAVLENGKIKEVF